MEWFLLFLPAIFLLALALVGFASYKIGEDKGWTSGYYQGRRTENDYWAKYLANEIKENKHG